MPDLSRRKLIGSLISLAAAPAIVRVSSIMPVKTIEPDIYAEMARWWATQVLPEPMDDLLKARLNDCYAVIRRNMQEIMFADYGAHGFDPLRRS